MVRDQETMKIRGRTNMREVIAHGLKIFYLKIIEIYN